MDTQVRRSLTQGQVQAHLSSQRHWLLLRFAAQGSDFSSDFLPKKQGLSLLPFHASSVVLSLIYIYIYIKLSFLFIYLLFMAALCLRCCAWALSSCSVQGLLFVAVRGFLIAVASLVAEHELSARELQ